MRCDAGGVIDGRNACRSEKTRLRREKNKIAARKCRQRKQDTFIETDAKLKQLQSEADELRSNATKTLLLVRSAAATATSVQACIVMCLA